MKELILRIERFPYTARTTSGKLYLCYEDHKDYFGFTLEDTARPANVKVMNETCITEGKYIIDLYESPHYGKTLIIYNQDDKRTIKAGPLIWTSCLFHGGNTHADTSGCVLVAKNRINNDTIQGSLKDELRIFVERKINEGYEVFVEFVNLPQRL